jgi:hypothetical protein
MKDWIEKPKYIKSGAGERIVRLFVQAFGKKLGFIIQKRGSLVEATSFFLSITTT